MREENGRLYTTARRGGSTLVAFPPGTWELVTSVPALQQVKYVVAVPTISNAAANDFVVTASTTTPSIWFASDAASAQSIDNLAPAQPTPFIGTYSAGAAHLTWGANTEHDLANYRLYRGSNADFEPVPGNLVATPTSTSYADAGAVAGDYFKLSAVDVNGNASSFAATRAGTTVAVNEGIPLVFALEGARPNPARRNHLNVTFAIPNGSSARLMLLDLNGRRVVEREVGFLGEGRHTSDLSKPHRLLPGIYWVRLVQGANRRTLRVTVLE